MLPTSSMSISRTANPELLADLEESFQVPLGKAFAAELDKLGEALFKLADRGLIAQTDAATGAGQVRRQRDGILARFNQHGARVWQALNGGRLLSADRLLAESTGGVKLLSSDELEIRLAIRSLAGAIAHSSRSELSRLEQYVGWISGGLKVDADMNPLGAEHVGVAVHEAFAEVMLAPKVRLAIILACEQALVVSVGKIYIALEEHLRHIAQAGPSLQMARKGRRKQIPTADQPEEFRQEEEQPDWINRFFSRWTAESAPASAGKVAGSAPASERGAPDVLPPTLQQLIRRARAEAPGASMPANVHRLSPRELHSILSLLQTMPGCGYPMIVAWGGALGPGLKREMLACAARLGLQVERTRLDEADEDVVDLVAMLFQILMEENHLAGRRRELIGALLVPVCKVALSDPRLFQQESHPVRRLLNLLAEACDGNQGESEHELGLLDKVAQVVDRIAADFDESLTIFLLLEVDFAEYFAQYKRKAEISERRVTERQRAQDRREQARVFVAGQMEERVGARALPPVARDFVEHAWNQYAQSLVLRSGEQGAPWVEASSTLDGFLAEFDRVGQGEPMRAFAEPFRAQLRKIFVGIGTSPQTTERAIDVLQMALKALHDARPDESIVLPELPAPPADAAEGEELLSLALPEVAKLEHIDNVTADFFRSLPQGAWLDFVGRDGRVQSGKLAWVSPISSRLMFVNRSGVRFCVASPEELAVMAHLGRLRLHREEDPFYSAMQGVVDNLSVGEATA